MSVDVNERVTNLEAVLERFIVNTEKSFERVNKQAERTKKELASLSKEMKEFKGEMGVFKDNMEKDRREMNKRWGDLANKMGALIEFIFFPGIGPAVEHYFKTKLDTKGIHFFKRIKKINLKGEFDIVATDPERVYLVEVKTSPDKEKLKRFKEKILPRFRKLYPEYEPLKLIPIYGSLYFSDDLIKYASSLGIYILAYREWEYMDILNFDQVNPD